MCVCVRLCPRMSCMYCACDVCVPVGTRDFFVQVNRLHDLHEALDDLGREAASSGPLRGQAPNSEDIVIDHADIVTPTRVPLATDVSVRVTPTTPLLVTGPNASGKSAFYRVIAGLWQVGNRSGDANGDGRGSVAR